MTYCVGQYQILPMTALTVLSEITVDGVAVTRRRERELLGLLVAARGRTVSVERILEEIWAGEG